MSLDRTALPLRVDILGPLVLRVAGRVVDVPGRRRRALHRSAAERQQLSVLPSGPGRDLRRGRSFIRRPFPDTEVAS